MEKMILASLPNGCRAAEQLLERYGPKLISQVEQMSEHIFRAWLTDGRLALCFVRKDGSLAIEELEAVC